MRYINRLIVIVLIIITFSDQTIVRGYGSTAKAPYIYYFSEPLNGVVVERADGTDSRLLSLGNVNKHVIFTYGPSWSPDGQWFAVHTEISGIPSLIGKGYVVSADGQTTLPMLDQFSCIYSMLWHPSENILLVYGSITTQRNACHPFGESVTTYWLIDVQTQTRLATFSINADPMLSAFVHWFPDQNQIQFFEYSHAYNAESSSPEYYRVTMNFDSRVTMEPVDSDVIYSDLAGIESHDDHRSTLFTSAAGGLPDSGNFSKILHNSSSAIDLIASWQWDVAQQWLLVGYEFCFASCSYVTGRVSIFNPATGISREIADCGGHPACVGWLPPQVDVDKLPPGNAISVLPAPANMDYSDGVLSSEEHYGTFGDIVSHDLLCNQVQRPWRLTVVQNRITRAIDFVLPAGDECHDPVEVAEPIIFALSPDQHYYAITTDSKYTSLYDAQTGEKIATLNFYGIRLAFSNDSRLLITSGRYAIATWDIPKLVKEIPIRIQNQ